MRRGRSNEKGGQSFANSLGIMNTRDEHFKKKIKLDVIVKFRGGRRVGRKNRLDCCGDLETCRVVRVSSSQGLNSSELQHFVSKKQRIHCCNQYHSKKVHIYIHNWYPSLHRQWEVSSLLLHRCDIQHDEVAGGVYSLRQLLEDK